MASSSLLRKKRLATIIRLQGYQDILPCVHCAFEFPCIRMPSVSVKCARCAEQGRSNCVSVSWESVERTITSSRETIDSEERMAEDDEEQEAVLKAQLRVIEDRRLNRRRKIRRLRKVLKQAEGRATDQARCLAEELDLEASDGYRQAWEGTPIDFGPELSQLAAHTPSLLGEVIEGVDTASPW